jgi:hypothetical protein
MPEPGELEICKNDGERRKLMGYISGNYVEGTHTYQSSETKGHPDE